MSDIQIHTLYVMGHVINSSRVSPHYSAGEEPGYEATCSCFIIIPINAALRFNCLLYASGASTRIWLVTPGPFSLCELGRVWAQDYLWTGGRTSSCTLSKSDDVMLSEIIWLCVLQPYWVLFVQFLRVVCCTKLTSICCCNAVFVTWKVGSPISRDFSDFLTM